MKGKVKRIIVIGLGLVMTIFLGACGIFGGSEDSKTELDKVSNIAFTCNQTTGKDAKITFDTVKNADGYKVTVEGAGYEESETVTKNEKKLDETKLIKNQEYTVKIIAKGSGNYKDSAEVSASFTYSFDSEILPKEIAPTLSFNKNTKILTISGGDKHDIIVEAPNGDILLEKYNTAEKNIDLSDLNLANSTNAGKAKGTTKGKAGISEDSVEASIILDNYKQQEVDPAEVLKQRMEAYAAWETQFKQTVGTSLQALSFNPSVTEIHGLEIKDSGNKSTVTVFSTHIVTGSGNTQVGSVSYEIDKVSGATYQDELNDINAKIAKSNIIAGTNNYTTINTSAPSLINDLSKSNKLPDSELKTLAQTQGKSVNLITDYATGIVSGGGQRGYSVGCLVKINEKYYFMIFGVSNPQDLRTDAQIYADLGNNTSSNQIINITESRWKEVGIAKYLELKEEYEAWQAQQ